MLDVKDVMTLLNVAEATAYKVMRELNAELKAQGFYVIRGRVPEKYLVERFNLDNTPTIQTTTETY